MSVALAIFVFPTVLFGQPPTNRRSFQIDIGEQPVTAAAMTESGTLHISFPEYQSVLQVSPADWLPVRSRPMEKVDSTSLGTRMGPPYITSIQGGA
jgi:hypothetical protein